jgi:hypothetical protein
VEGLSFCCAATSLKVHAGYLQFKSRSDCCGGLWVVAIRSAALLISDIAVCPRSAFWPATFLEDHVLSLLGLLGGVCYRNNISKVTALLLRVLFAASDPRLPPSVHTA